MAREYRYIALCREPGEKQWTVCPFDGIPGYYTYEAVVSAIREQAREGVEYGFAEIKGVGHIHEPEFRWIQ